MNPGERDRLIDDLLDGDISEADFLRLEAEMIVDEEARRAYYDRQKLSTGLVLDAAEHHDGGSDESVTPAHAGRPTRFRVDWLVLTAATVFALLVGLLGWKIGQDTARAVRGPEPVVSGFGAIAGPVGGTWADGTELREGDLVPGGERMLESGFAFIELFSGVELLVTAPARFEIRSGMEVVLEQGSIQARVPDVARGFRVILPSGEAKAEVAEFVSLVGLDGSQLQIIAGHATCLFEGESIQASFGEGFHFSREENRLTSLRIVPPLLSELKARLAAERSGRFAGWERKASELENNPLLLLHLSLGEADSNATVVRAEPVADRWGRPGGALDFSPTGSRVRVDVPGEHRSLTLMCWVRIDGLDRLFNSLFLTDGHELHEPHWQIMDDGRLFFSVRAREVKGKKDKHIVYSPPVWTPARAGQWMHLATVYDGEAQTVAHYADGELLVLEPIPEELHPSQVVIGPASVGNWSEPKYRTDPEFVMRNLNGAIDDLWVFGRALGAGEVAKVWGVGRP